MFTWIEKRLNLNYGYRLGNLPKLEDKQRQALLQFRTYSKRLLTTELEDFRAGELDKLPREKEVSPKVQKLKMKLISLKSPEKEPVTSSQDKLTEELGSFFAKA